MSITRIGEMFFLAINHQQNTINKAVNNPGYTESNLSCKTKYAFPDEFVNLKDVFTVTQVAATPPTTIPPTVAIALRIAFP